MRRRRSMLGAAAILAAAATGGAAMTAGAPRARGAAAPARASTAKVTRRALSAVVAEPGILTYRARPDGSPYSVIDQASGVYTELPGLGRVVGEGHVLYRVNNRPVVLLHGSTPAYRTLSAGASGPDVAELNADLVALGDATRAQMGPSSAIFGAATTLAVEKLQAALGVTQTGTLILGQVVFEPSAMRVTGVPAALGGSAQPGATVIQASSTTREVQVALSAAQQTEVAVGDRVSITLPDDRTTPGVISAVGAVATCPASAGSGSTSSSAMAGADTCASGSAGSPTPTINVEVTPSRPSATGRWDQAPVQIGITTAHVRDALVVPVTALLARSGNGYAVEILGRGARRRLVTVSLGLFDDADGLVQVTGAGLAAGQHVVVAST